METQSQGQSSTRISDLPVWQGQQVPQQVTQQIPPQVNQQIPPHVPPQVPPQVPQNLSYSPQIPPVQQQSHQFKGQTTGELPSRDIPTHTQNHVVDENSKANFIPTNEKHVRFIEDYEDENDEDLDTNEAFESSIFRYKEPLILMLLFFIFHMSIVNAKLYQYVPKLFVQEGELSGLGVFVKASVFVTFYMAIQYIMKNGMKVI